MSEQHYQLQSHILELALEFTFTISRSSTQVAKTVLVELSTDYSGQTYTGIGEAVPAAYYHETPESVQNFYRVLIQDNALNNLDPFNQQVLEERLAAYPDNQAARAGLEIAFYDLRGKILNQPVWRYLGLDKTKAPKTSYTIGIADSETVRLKTQKALERGYDILKVKLGGPSDLESLRLIRDVAPGVTIRADANAAWTLNEALELLPRLQDYQIEFIEEPLKTDSAESDYTTLFKESPIMLMADERCKTLNDLSFCARHYGAINLKHTKTGGLAEAMRMIHAARAMNLKIMLGCFAESSVSISAFAQLSPLVDYTDLDGSLLLANDPYTGIHFKGNQFFLQDKPGIGVHLK